MENFDNVQVIITGYFAQFQKCLVQFNEQGIRIEIRADWQLPIVVPRLKENLVIDMPYTDIDRCNQRVGSVSRLQAQLKLKHHNEHAPKKIFLIGKSGLIDAFQSHGIVVTKPSLIKRLLFVIYTVGLLGALAALVAFLSMH